MSNVPDPQVLAALADSTRRRLLDLLAAEPLSASALARRMTISRQGIVKHLDVLSRAGLLRSRREGREVVYEADPAPLEAVSRWLERSRKSWQGQLQGLKAAAEHRQAETVGRPGTVLHLSTDDVDAAYAWMEAAGMQVVSEPSGVDGGRGFAVVMPSGARMWVQSTDRPPGSRWSRAAGDSSTESS